MPRGLLAEQGCLIVAASDSSGGVYSERGIDPDALRAHKDASDGIAGYGEADPVSTRDVLEVPCDILIPAALERAIDADNAGRIEASIVVEGANGPTTAEADDILASKGVTVVPDILANAGGVVVSYFEWVQDTQGYFWDIDEVNGRMESIMVRSFDEVAELAGREDIQMRDAATMLAVGRVAEATRVRGVYP